MRVKEVALAESLEIPYRLRRITPGHRLCAGCSHPIIVKQVFLGLPPGVPVVACTATGCLEVSTTLYPDNAWNIPWIHSAFENAAATAAGIESAYRALKKRGKIKREVKIVAFAGDGGTHDIGLQALSGALERRHNMVYACLDNEAYMNTGIQRSSATPLGASTTTAPAGRVVPGKLEPKKDICLIAAAHRIPYIAQASPSHPADLLRKAKKAFRTEGPSFLNIISPCPAGWRFDSSESIEIASLAVETCYWPLYEIEEGNWRLTYRPDEKLPVEEWLRKQGRFRHLFKKKENKWMLEVLQEEVDKRWEELLRRVRRAEER